MNQFDVEDGVGLLVALYLYSESIVLATRWTVFGHIACDISKSVTCLTSG